MDDSGKPRSRSIGIMLSGKPPDWDVLNPDDLRLEWFDPSVERSRTEKMAELKGGYSRLLWDCCRFFHLPHRVTVDPAQSRIDQRVCGLEISVNVDLLNSAGAAPRVVRVVLAGRD